MLVFLKLAVCSFPGAHFSENAEIMLVLFTLNLVETLQ